MEKSCGISYITTSQELIINYLQKKIHRTNIVENSRTFPGFFRKINKSQDFPGHFSNSRTFHDFPGSVETLCKNSFVW